jgi:hypothetical protein
LHRFGQAFRLAGFRRQGLSLFYIAKRAISGAYVAEYQERGGSPGVAFGYVGTTRLVANRMKAEACHGRFSAVHLLEIDFFYRISRFLHVFPLFNPLYLCQSSPEQKNRQTVIFFGTVVPSHLYVSQAAAKLHYTLSISFCTA